MSFEEEFDKIVRAKADEENYPFDERNWEKTSSLIDADRKATRMLKLQKFYFPALLIIGLGSASIVAYNFLAPNEREVSVRSLASTTANSITSPSTAQIETNNLNKEITGSEQTKKSVESEAQENLSEKSPSGNQIITNATSKPSKIPTEKINSAAAESIASEVSRQKNEQSQAISLNDVTDMATESVQKNDLENTKIDHDKSAVASQIGKVNPDPASLAGTPASDKNEYKENAIVATSESTSAETQQFTSERLASVNSNLPYETTDRDILVMPFSMLSRYDDDYYRNNLKKKHFLNLEAGAGYLMGWDTKNGKDAKGLNWFGGLNYGFYLTQKISFGIGVQAYNIGNIEHAFYVNAKKEYSFGSSTSYTMITSNDLYYLAVPLKFNYSLNTSNTIGFGVNAAYLMSAANTVSTYSVQQEYGTSVPVSTHNTGIYEGTRLTNLMFSAHYNAKLNKRISVNAELNYGLTDIFENKGTITNKETPVGFRLSLQYTLFDK